MANVKQVEPRQSDENDFKVQAKEYVYLKKELEQLEKRQKEIRKEIFEHLDLNGEEDSKGNLFVELEEPIDEYVAVVKQRRVSRKIDEQKAEELIESRGLQDKLYKTIRVVDEDALMAALYSDELTEDDIDSIYPASITWALVLNKR